MTDNSLILSSKDTERKIIIVALIVSLLFHLLLLVLVKFNFFGIFTPQVSVEQIPDEVTVIFPENKPLQVVENMNENQQVPDDTRLLSETNSRASNRIILDNSQNQPYSEGNTELQNLAEVNLQDMSEIQNRRNYKESEQFDRSDLMVDYGPGAAQQQTSEQMLVPKQIESLVRKKDGTNNMYDQKEYSVDMLGDITLSTYEWDWAYYMNMFKKKLYEVWRTPPAYYVLGMISGNTMMKITIDRQGNLTESIVLEHNGHESLQLSSVNAINNVFPFSPLPVDFPDDSLVVNVNLIYPEFKQRNR